MALDESWAHVSTPEMEGRDKQSGMVGTEANSLKEEWGEASRLLFQPGYLKVIKEMALSGQLKQYNIRSVCWRLFLGCLPEDQLKWGEATRKSREKFTAIKNKYIIDPHNCESGKDLAVHNPLSLADDSPWNQFFQDNELKQMINQDVVRTFPDVQFFRQPHIQSTLVDLLFCYSRENEELGYRQGMHEILAPIVFALHAEIRDLDDPTLAPSVMAVMDPRYIEHDIYTIFAELMESVGPWYQSTALEADFFKARAQNKKKMNHDPRTNKPFQEFSDFAATSAISRKLDVIHNLHLKNADDLLYSHLKELSIPPQTYGIRWIRLLFGREFPLPTVLELWDALFADGPSLGLVDYMCVAMLMHIRDVLTGGDYAYCMQYLMHFPDVYEVNYLVQRALHLRNPSTFPSPRIWSHSPSAQANYSLGSTHSQSSTDTTTHHSTHSKLPKVPSMKQFARHVQLPRLQRSSRPNSTGPRLEFHGNSKSRSRSPSPTHSTTVVDHPLQASVGSTDVVNKPKGRGKIIGSVKSETEMNKKSKEMSENPKSAPLTNDSSSRLDKLRNRVDDLQAKCLYCGGKADTLISALQDEIIKLEGLPPETENTLLLSLAGLKQVRDLLMNKIPFSGESVEGWENLQGANFNIDNSLDSSDAINLDDDSEPASKSSPPVGNITVTKDSNNRTLLLPTPSVDSMQRSLEVGTEVLPDDVAGEDWVSLPSDTHTHPLTDSGN